jgi:SEC-C motif-containing protein
VTSFTEHVLFLHAHWALWRMGQRHPAAALAAFRAATPGASAARRCGIAEHLGMLPASSATASALTDLLDGFAGFAKEPDAAYLLLAVTGNLARQGRKFEAKQLRERYQELLPRKGREWLQEMLESDESYVPLLVREEIDRHDIDGVCLDRVFLEDMEEDDEQEEQIEAPQAPAVKPGRNDPCWCGSGKKYKKCHLAADEKSGRTASAPTPAPSVTPAADPVAARLLRDVLQGAKQWHSRSDFRQATRLYFDQEPDELDVGEADTGNFFEWFIHDFRSAATGRTAIEEYVRRRGPDLPAREREMLQSWSEARFSVYEVQAVEEGRGVKLRDLFAGDQFFVHDVTSSRELVRWDCSLSRVEEFEGRRTFSGNGMLVPRNVLPEFLERIESEARSARQSPAEFVRANSHRLHRVVQELHGNQLANLHLVNAEGDAIEFSTALYEVRDGGAALGALRAVGELEEEDAAEDAPDVHRFAWLQTGVEGPRRCYGHIEIREGRLRLECNARPRLERGRELLENAAGRWLRHLRDSFESPESAGRKAAAGAAKSWKKAIPPEVEREIILTHKKEHYAGWPDAPLPALYGRTPREAVKTPEGREAVMNLIRMMENREERLRKRGGAAYDFSELKATLGLD